MTRRVAVVGGGVIGLACAWRLAATTGDHVTVYDGAPEAQEASWAAAGMLAPHHEAERPDALWHLGVASLARWERFATDLGGPAALDFRMDGGLVPVVDDRDLAEVGAKRAFAAANGVAAAWLDRGALARHEPRLAGCAGALLLPGGQVNPRRLTSALRAACAARGVELRYGTAIAALYGLADLVVLASGAWTPALARLAGIELAGEPVKGQLLRFAMPSAAPAADTLLRHFVHSHHAYLVPRAGDGDGGGSLVVGSTMVHSGFDKTEDAAAIAHLAASARRLLPALDDALISETWTGLRPRLRSGLPLLARVRDDLLIATGHFRNGILLTPVTADAVAELAGGPPCGVDLSPFAG